MKSLELLLLMPEVNLSLFLEHASFVLQHWHTVSCQNPFQQWLSMTGWLMWCIMSDICLIMVPFCFLTWCIMPLYCAWRHSIGFAAGSDSKECVLIEYPSTLTSCGKCDISVSASINFLQVLHILGYKMITNVIPPQCIALAWQMINNFLFWSGSALRTHSGFSPKKHQLVLKELVPVCAFISCFVTVI